jgi:subtilisin family serine protease
MKKILLVIPLIFISIFQKGVLEAQILETDSLALLSLFFDTGGSNWTDNTNWLSAEPVSTWLGITVSGNRVTKIELPNNNLVGAIPQDLNLLNQLNELRIDQNSISNIPNLIDLFSLNKLIVNDNELSSLPQIGSSVLLDLICHNNRLEFDDLQPFVGLVVGNFQYAPQADIGDERFKYVRETESIELTVDVGGNPNLYNWLKDGIAVNPSPMTVPNLTISNASPADEGAYVVEITNPNLPDLTLKSRPCHLQLFKRDDLGGEYVPNQLIIEFTADASQFERDTMLAYYEATRLDVCLCGVLELWQLPDTSITPQGDMIIGIEGVKEDALTKSNVEESDRNYIMFLLGNERPSESYATNYEAKEESIANKGVLDDLIQVAVIDVGIDTTISLLYPFLWINEEEIINGEDDDENCLIDDTRGYDFINRNNRPMDAINGHGTHVTGIIANGLPGTDIRLMNIKTHDDDGLGLLFEATCAIYYAFQKGAKVINLSWGYRGEPAPVLENAIARAGEDCKALVVTSAGNESLDNDVQPHYPSSFELDNIISVAALNFDENDLLAASNYGLNSVDIAAPGDSIFSNLPNPQGFGYKSGTSMAAAAVSRAAALLFKENPNATYLNIIDAIMSTAESVATLDNIASGGKLDLDAALNFIQTIEPDTACLLSVGINPELPPNISSIMAYPNPFHNALTIEVELEQTENIELLIFDVMGRLVFQQYLESTFYSNQFYWNGRNLQESQVSDGLYFAHLKAGDESVVIRLLKM